MTDWRAHPDAQALLDACRQVREVFGGDWKLESVHMDGELVAGKDEQPTQNTITLTAEQVVKLTNWSNTCKHPKYTQRTR